MQKIKLMLEFMHGPIWPSDPFTGRPTTGNRLIDEDAKLAAWNTECSRLYDECYEFESHGKSCYFNPKTFDKHRNELLDLLNKIKIRLIEIDGSISIDDQTRLQLLTEE
ncbi:hypothetical protein [Lactobacillus corticis]|uniref:Uncharacterized protein n=1 Tax=Lactobacillus corticis TaxID=2201249 RepID=A0A916VHS3_9LACO|nr:hypothetical protein [Lactobacillus corticis]GFZ27376.1 hypothetical protein LCB40_12560 [Lactobacillus corticis]